MRLYVSLIIAVVVALANTATVKGANILAVFPFPAKSHHAVFQPIVKGLAAKGHHVTYITPNLIKDPPANIKQIELANVMVKLKNSMEAEQKGLIPETIVYIMNNWCNMLVREIGYLTTEFTLESQQIKEIVDDPTAKYDLILLESTFAQEGMVALAHRFNAWVVEVLPLSNMHWTYYVHGNPFDTSYIVDIDLAYSDHMNFKERLTNTFFSMLNRVVNTYYYMPKNAALVDKYLRYPGWETRPPLLDIVKNTSMVLLNTNLAVNYPYPMSPNVKEIGGINLQTEAKPLPKEFKDFMDGAQDGVIYFTMGSHIDVSSQLGDTLKEEFLKVFGKIKQRVLWKWEKEFPNLPANVKVSKWFPQQDILAHKNMKLFISHGGLLSVTEAVNSGIPIIGIPVMGDQQKNVRQTEAIGYGIYLDFANLTESSISWAINEILSNHRYAQIAKQRSEIYKDKKQTPLETALYWIEYVLRNEGAHHLKPSVASMPWCQQALVDVYLTLAAIIFLPFALIYILIRSICRCVCGKSKNLEKKKKKD